MLINKVTPIEVEDELYIHCNKEKNESDHVIYFIAEKGHGKSSETMRQAVFRRDMILSTEYDFYSSAGLKHISNVREGEVGYMGLRDIFNKDFKLSPEIKSLNLCVDNSRELLEELLSYRYKVPVKINFMSLEG